MAKQEFIEQVNWNEGAIANTATKLVGFYAKSLRELGTNHWLKFTTEKLLPNIKGRRFNPIKFKADGFDLIFSWPFLQETQHEDFTLWQEAEPRFVLFDKSRERLIPSERNKLYQITDEITKEAEEVYGLIAERQPISFIFAKASYAKRIEMHRATLLA